MWFQTSQEIKATFPKVGMDKICGMFGKTRQAYYWKNEFVEKRIYKEEAVLMMVQSIRKKMPRIGGRKLYNMIYPNLKMEDIKLGRDKFFDLLRANGLLNKQRKNRIKTTFSGHWFRKYKNLIKGYEPEAPNRLWVTDITYIRLEKGFCYLSLVTDVYSRKILGWHLNKTLEAEGTIKALKMALKNLLPKENRPALIHHSDRGIQYCSHDYVNILKKNGVTISMTENGDPLENAIAERLNGILKDEFLLSGFQNSKEAKAQINEAVFLYNSFRPHLSLGYLTPDRAYGLTGKLPKVWKNYYPHKTVEVDSHQLRTKELVN